MELSKLLLKEGALREYTSDGELLPDPNLIFNIDHLASFIQMEIDSWRDHSHKINKILSESNELNYFSILFEETNVRVYIKSLFNLTTYYVACTKALEKLMRQLYKLSTEHYSLHLKKPKFENDKIFQEKIQFLRDKSFIHQDSEKVENLMDKRLAMSWMPTLSYLTGQKPTCESYVFGSGKWMVQVNGIKKESEKDIAVIGFMSFSMKAQEQIELNKIKIVNYYSDIKDALR